MAANDFTLPLAGGSAALAAGEGILQWAFDSNEPAKTRQIARFKTEAHAAAQILHPHIVPVFSIGIDRGVHFYAMQLIDGQPLDRAIAEMQASRQAERRPIRRSDEEIRVDPRAAVSSRQAACDVDRVQREATPGLLLNSRERSSRDYFYTIARLGVQAAGALHAAHEHGIVLRDVKPSNLLLDREGKLWVTDFGLARCQRNAALSKTGEVVGTMRYMSPEQASGETSLIDQRTDVYSLGVTLYELLTLRPAIPGDDGPQLLRKLDAGEPAPPRKLNPEIPVDFENVILKAIAKCRDDRYTSAAEFARDLQRFLDGKPTTAKRPTPVERAAKWATRHRRIVALTLGVLLLACVGLAVSTLLVAREQQKAAQSFALAERNREVAHRAVERFGSQFADRLASIPGAAGVRLDMLRATLEYYQRFAEQAADDPALRGDLGLTYSKIGSLADKMGSTDEAISAHRKAIALFERLVATGRDELADRQRLGMCYNNLALALQRAGQIEEAGRSFSEAIETQASLVRRSPSRSLRSEFAITQTNFGLLLSETGQQQPAEEAFREAIRLQEQLAAELPADTRQRSHLATAYNNLSAVYLRSDPENAAQCYRAALDHLRLALSAEPDNPELVGSFASTWSNLGSLLSRQRADAAAASAFEKAIESQRKLVASVNGHQARRRDLAISFNNYGLVLSRLKRTADAERAFRESLDLHQGLIGLDRDDIALRSSCGGVWNNLGIILEDQARFEAAVAAYQEAITQQAYAYSRGPAVTRYRQFLSKHYYNLGRVLRERGRGEQAVDVALQRRGLWSDEPDRWLSVAEEITLAAPLAKDADRAAALAAETWEQAVAAGARLPTDIAQQDTLAQLRRATERLPRAGPKQAFYAGERNDAQHE